MDKIAIVDNSKKPQLYELVLERENMVFSKFKTREVLKNSSKLNEFDIILLNIDNDVTDIVKIIKELKRLNKENIIVAMSLDYIDENIQQTISSGADDFLKRPINRSMFLKKLGNYSSLLSFRKKPIRINESHYNLFTDKIFSKNIRFNINKKDDLLEFWDCCMPNIISDSKLCRFELIFSICEWLIGHDNKFFIVSEEDENNRYITINYSPIPKNVIHNLIYNNCNLDEDVARIDNKKLTIKIEKWQEKIDESFKEKSKKENHNLNAKEFVNLTPLEITSKIDMLEDIENNLIFEINKLNTSKNNKTLKTIGELFNDYSSIVFLLNEFVSLSEAISKVADVVGNANIKQLEEDGRIDLIISVLYSLVDDLINWRMSIFINQEASDIHYLDNSMLSSCFQIEALLGDEKVDNQYGEIEFF